MECLNVMFTTYVHPTYFVIKVVWQKSFFSEMKDVFHNKWVVKAKNQNGLLCFDHWIFNNNNRLFLVISLPIKFD